MTKRERIYQKFDGKCAYTGTPLLPDWQVDHIVPKWRFDNGFPVDGAHNDETNLVPCQRIINHYKREKDLSQFREYIVTLHIRLEKLPKNCRADKTIKHKKYLNDVASLFGISVDNPFKGIFYFETIKQK